MKLTSAARARNHMRLEPYRSYGRRSEMVFTGRVLANRIVAAATEDERRHHSVRRMVRRFWTREVAGAQVRVVSGDQSTTAISGSDGHYRAVLDVSHQTDRWANAHCSLVEATGNDSWLARSVVIDEQLSHLVISDIDDTVLASAAGKTLGTIMATLTGSLLTRRPVEGTPNLYRQLGGRDTVVVYVSSSPWNLHDFLSRFLQRHGFPQGPMILRDFGLNRATLGGSAHGGHKADAITSILALCPNAKVVLIGDTSQQDPDAFAQIATEHGDQIVAICLRDVGDAAKATAAKEHTDRIMALDIVYAVVDSMSEIAPLLDSHTTWFEERTS